jgi:hypothetical protein
MTVIKLPPKTQIQIDFETELEALYPNFYDFTRLPWPEPLIQYKNADTRHAFVGYKLAIIVQQGKAKYARSKYAEKRLSVPHVSVQTNGFAEC